MKKSKKSAKSRATPTFRPTPHLERVKYFALACIFMGIALTFGKIYQRQTHADTFIVSAEAEHGTAAIPAKSIDDAAASGGSAVTFVAGGTGGGSKTGNCKAPAGLKIQDTDTISGHEGEPGPPWSHKYGDAAVVYFQTSKLDSEYAGYVQANLAIWNASPCVDFRAVDACPSNSNCVVASVDNSQANGGDAVFEWDEKNSVLTNGTLTFDKNALDAKSVAYRRMVIAHEMGHAASLGHRATKTDLMYYASGEKAALVADTINISNILAIYGVQSNATNNILSAKTAPGVVTKRVIRDSFQP